MSRMVDKFESRWRRSRKAASIGVLTVVMAMLPLGSASAATDPDVVRWGGADRYEVSANISRANFDPGVGTVFIANGLASADALAAGPVAGIQASPILLVKKDSIPSLVATELDRLNPGRIVVLGGTGSVSATVSSKLNAYSSQVLRWGGADRYEVAANISLANFSSGVGTVYVANGLASADALAAGPVAGMAEGPILLVKKDVIPAVTAGELARLNPARIVVLGGTGSVSAAVATALMTYADTVDRWGGADRYEVSANISETNFPRGAGTVFIANGLASADALAAGPVAVMSRGPILLTKKDGIPTSVRIELERLNPSRIVVLGGVGSVSSTVENMLAVYLGPYPVRVSVATDGTQADYHAVAPGVSGDGRYVAYYSEASTLVPGDTNGAADVFLWDRFSRKVIRASVGMAGAQSNGTSYGPAISSNGRYVAFASRASNLVVGDTNGMQDIFLWDRVSGSTTRVSVSTGGAQANSESYFPRVSGDGRYVSYLSRASNLVPGDTNGARDVFVWDRVTGTTTRVSVATGGGQANDESQEPVISADGSHVTYYSWATNLVPGDTNGVADVFLWERATGTTTRVSSELDGTQSTRFTYSPAINATGRFIAYMVEVDDAGGMPTAEDYVTDIYLHDTDTDTTIQVSLTPDGSQPERWSHTPSISADGRYVAYNSWAANLVAGDTNDAVDVFVWNRLTNTTARVSRTITGAEATDWSDAAAISGDGRFVAFRSFASNLVTGDTNGVIDVFLTRNPL